MPKATTILVEETAISIVLRDGEEYLSLSDLAKKFGEPRIVIQNWMRTRNTIQFLGVWETMHNAVFDRRAFDEFLYESGGNTFTLSPTKWIESTRAIGMTTKGGRYGGGTFGHKDIAFGFCYWLNPAFQLYVIKEFQRLKQTEAEENRQALDWNLRRTLSKINYHIHTDAVRSHLVPPLLQNTRQEGVYYATEADLLNLALFGTTAKQWREANPDLRGNLREHASTEQLLVLANIENLNAEFIKQGLDKAGRLQRLNEIAIHQMQLLLDMPGARQLGAGEGRAPVDF